MNKQIKINFILGLFILLISLSGWASIESDFNQGLEYFSKEDYAAAVIKFESANKQGLNSVSLHYNLASSYYKLGEYEKAKVFFKRVALLPEMKDLADYNLGLIAIKQNNKSVALKYFNSLVSTGNDEKLIRLSEKQLIKLNKKTSNTINKKEILFSAYVSSNPGYDNNISSASSDSVLGISDNFIDLYATADWLISGKRKNGWVADASIFNIDYSDTDSNDEEQYTLGLKRAFKLQGWETSAKLNWLKNTFGGENYLTTTRMDVRGRKVISKGERIYLRYRLDDIGSDNVLYDYLAGWRQRARIEYRNYSAKNIKQIYYELELNDRGALETSTYAYDYSPTRHTLRAIYTHVLNNKWRLHGDVQYRFSDYPSSPTVDREDDLLKLTLSSDYHFNRTFKLTAKIQFTENASTVTRYTYDKYVVRVGLSKAF